MIGSGGQVFYALAAPRREDEPGPADDLTWAPPPHLAHLPVPFDLIARRITRKQQQGRAPETPAPAVAADAPENLESASGMGDV
jgi:hypothetical protein